MEINILHLIIAMLMGSFGAHPFIYVLVRSVWKTVEPDSAPQYEALAEGLGNVERALYVGALFFSQPAFIVAWLGLKIAVKWKSWQAAHDASDEESHKARAQYLLFLYGSGLSVLGAVFGFLLSKPVFEYVMRFLS